MQTRGGFVRLLIAVLLALSHVGCGGGGGDKPQDSTHACPTAQHWDGTHCVNDIVADTTPPTVTVTAPTQGSTVSGTVSLVVRATDNVGVAEVSLLLDGVNVSPTFTQSPAGTYTAPNGMVLCRRFAA